MNPDSAYLFDMLQSAELAVSYLEGIEYKNFADNIMLQDAVLRRIEVTGEASHRITAQTKLKNNNFAWKEMRGVRNYVLHTYSELDPEEIWNTVKNEFPELIKQLKEIIEK
jgi:uncharacterized protein with HEPN domain